MYVCFIWRFTSNASVWLQNQWIYANYSETTDWLQDQLSQQVVSWCGVVPLAWSQSRLGQCELCVIWTAVRSRIKKWVCGCLGTATERWRSQWGVAERISNAIWWKGSYCAVLSQSRALCQARYQRELDRVKQLDIKE